MTMHAIIGMKKLKTWGNIGGSGAHTYRVEGMAPNADPSRSNLNSTLVGTPHDVLGDVRRRVDAVTDSPRKNAVLCVEFMLSASPEFWDGKTEKQINTWAKAQIAWLQKTYGKANVTHAVLHRDETSPHVVAYVVPEVDGKLNARALFGGREKMRDMHTDYAAANARFGLARGVEGSRARHTTVKSYYARLEAVADAADRAVKKLSKPTPPPKRKITQTPKAYATEVETWTKQEEKRVKSLTNAAARAITAVRTLQEEVEVLKGANAALTAQNEDMALRLSDAYRELGLTKEEVGTLRRLDVSRVATELGYLGTIKPKENAIDLVKRVSGFDYEQAVAWLATAFNPEQAAAAVQDYLAVKTPERPFTPAENKIKQAVEKQLDALGCDKYRVTLASNNKNVAPYLPGKFRDKDGQETERYYTKKDITKMIPWLRFENNSGKHIFITPMDDNAYYVLVDDLRITPRELSSKGFEPCVVAKTSWDKHQAVLKVTKDVADRRAVIDFFNEVNAHFGDKEMKGLRHPFRLAGFRNMKSDHARDGKQPFVELVQAVNRFCTKSMAIIRQRYGGADPEAAPPDQKPRP
jgi:hypothetical protein